MAIFSVKLHPITLEQVGKLQAAGLTVENDWAGYGPGERDVPTGATTTVIAKAEPEARAIVAAALGLQVIDLPPLWEFRATE